MPTSDEIDTVTIKIKHPLTQMFCKHKYEVFRKPIDRKTNPYGFMALNDIEPTIRVCVKCGKKIE